MKNFINKIFPYFCFIILSCAMLYSSFMNLSENAIFGKVLRLHVIGASDSHYDQQIKLYVRDGILSLTKELFSDCQSVDEAKIIAQKNIDRLTSAADKVLYENGVKDRSRVTVSKEIYPEKAYGNLVFPEGEYLSVRVIIGEGRGKNWWCVLFPPLCNAGIEEGPEILGGYGIDKDEIDKLKSECRSEGITIFGTKVTFKFSEYFR